MIFKLIVTTKARKDIKGILFYTKKQWGISQRTKYRGLLFHAMERLKQNPDMGRKWEGMAADHKYIRAGKHSIFYKIENKNAIHILRVLHQRMDFQQHLN